MFEKILVPLDGSVTAEQALVCAVQLAEAFNSELNIISIFDEKSTTEKNICLSYVENKAYDLRKTIKGQEIKIKTVVLPGSPAQKILDFVQQQEIRLIVMSSHGRSGILLWPLGSTADKILRRTRVPLIMVKIKEMPADNDAGGLFKRILVALDGSELAARVLPFSAELAARFNSEVILFRVIETDRPVHNLGVIDSVPYLEYELESAKNRAAEYLKHECSRFSKLENVKILVKTGNVAQEIIQYAQKNNCSLIALSSHTHSSLESWVIGSVTNKVLHAGQRSILFVPAAPNAF